LYIYLACHILGLRWQSSKRREDSEHIAAIERQLLLSGNSAKTPPDRRTADVTPAVGTAHERREKAE